MHSLHFSIKKTINLELWPSKITVFVIVFDGPPVPSLKQPLYKQTVVASAYECLVLIVTFKNIVLLFDFDWFQKTVSQTQQKNELSIRFHFVIVDDVGFPKNLHLLLLLLLFLLLPWSSLDPNFQALPFIQYFDEGSLWRRVLSLNHLYVLRNFHCSNIQRLLFLIELLAEAFPLFVSVLHQLSYLLLVVRL